MKIQTRRKFLLPVAALATMFVSRLDAADVIVGRKVPTEEQVSLGDIDHRPWSDLLSRFVDRRGRVNYTAWKQSRAASKALDRYLNHLSLANGVGPRQEKLAFWINAYNALTIKGILREYPTSSIRNHTAVLFGYNIWKNLKLVVGGEQYSLDEIEHEILRKLGEPRIHFAIVCASIGCPRLLAEAYEPSRIDEQLTRNARDFFADPSKFRFDSAESIFYVSPILKWFGEDFGESRAAQLKIIAPWIPEGRASQTARQGRGTLRFLDYDWGLNDLKSD